MAMTNSRGQMKLSHKHREKLYKNRLHDEVYYARSDESSIVDEKYRKLPFRKRLGRFLKSQEGWLFVLPAVLLMAVFTFWPIINSFIQAFQQDYSTLHGNFDGWGIGNFKKVLEGFGTGGAKFTTCLANTMIFTFISVPASTVLALIISVALSNIKVLQKAYQTIFFLPYLTNALAMGAVFATFFKIIGTPSNTETIGLINNILKTLGVIDESNPIKWVNIGAEIWAQRTVVIVYEIWSGLPFKILILFSALQSVNKQYYDAAKVDGASKNTVLWRITAPLISPMLSYLLVTGIMGGMKQYSAVVGIFGQDMGPGHEYEMGTMVGYIYFFVEDGHTGYAAAGSLMLFAIIMVITLINQQLSKRRVHY